MMAMIISTVTFDELFFCSTKTYSKKINSKTVEIRASELTKQLVLTKNLYLSKLIVSFRPQCRAVKPDLWKVGFPSFGRGMGGGGDGGMGGGGEGDKGTRGQGEKLGVINSHL